MSDPGTRKYTQLPPRGVGDRVHMLPLYVIPYKSYTSGTVNSGDIITTQTSGFECKVIEIEEVTASTGFFYVACNNENGDVVLNEDILLDAGTVAAVNADGYVIFTPVNVISSGDDPYRKLKIDEKGAAYFRFAEGPLELDAFGRARVSEGTQLGSYTFPYSENAIDWLSVTSGGGTAVYEGNTASVVMTTPTTAGAYVIRTTHTYHKYISGQSHLIEVITVCGDSGKANLRRRWGYFDDENGIFFEVTGTVLRVGLRSKVTGSVVDTYVDQSDWNVDTLDGSHGLSNPSGIAINIASVQRYWFDFQFPAGRIRWGIESGGSRIVVHEYRTSNTNPTPPMRTASLPVRWEQTNIGTVVSSSEMRHYHARVWTEGALEPVDRRPRNSNSGGMKTVGYHTGTPLDPGVPCVSIRPKSTFGGRPNRSVILTDIVSVVAIDDTTGLPCPIAIDIIAFGTLTGADWAATAFDVGSAVDSDNAATTLAFNGASQLKVGEFISSGDGSFNVTQFSTYQGGNKLTLSALGGVQPTATIAARTLNPAQTAKVYVTIQWSEVDD